MQTKKIFNLVVTGGPCSGKTTAIPRIVQEFTYSGFHVMIIPETATEYFSTGVCPMGDFFNNYEFQKVIFEKQIWKEEMYREIAEKLPKDKILILHDRGIIDNKSYVSDTEFNQLLSEFGLNELEARERYDGVIHLVTAADGAEKFYTLENNAARSETPEEARILDRKGIANWTGHTNFKIIDNRTDFDNKIKRLINEVHTMLGEPIPVQTQRKFLIEFPELNILESHGITTIDIVQTYLKSVEGIDERRIRQFGQNGNYYYFYTEKQILSPGKSLKSERNISSREYSELLTQLNPAYNTIVKKRYCFSYQSQIFKLDAFNFSDKYAIIETETTNDNDTIVLPSWINPIREVTDDMMFYNMQIAKMNGFSF